MQQWQTEEMVAAFHANHTDEPSLFRIFKSEFEARLYYGETVKKWTRRVDMLVGTALEPSTVSEVQLRTVHLMKQIPSHRD